MKNTLKELKKYPIIIFFLCFLVIYSIGDCFARAKKYDEYENRDLAQFPKLTWEGLISNEWTQKYETYVQDQFLLRHEWIVAKSFTEGLLLRTENNNVVYGKDGYQFYKFMELNAGTGGEGTQLAQNTAFLTQFAARHPGRINVMLVPSASNILADKLPAGVPILDENPLMDDFFAEVSSVAEVIDVRGAFRENAEEYLYYRTDHHWTTDGAYLAYKAAADALETGAFDPAAHTAVEVEGFTGTNFNKSLKHNTVEDTLKYYQLDNPLTIKQLLPDGSEYSADEGGLYDLDKLDVRDKYAMFLRGNNGYSTIAGDAANGRRILVIKDSYANCFVPFLTADYEQIDVVDLRFWKNNVETLMELFDYDEVLVLYNFQTFTSETSLFYLNAMIAAD